MKISEILRQDRGSFSFEVFPPKKQEGFEKIERVVERLCRQHPSYISVTFGAAGGRDSHTADVAAFIRRQGATPLAHLTCVSYTRDELHRRLTELRTLGIENILALRGDLPAGMTPEDLPADRYRYASELTAAIRDFGGFCVGGACYPETHVECSHWRDDIDHLRRKVEAGADFLTTQMFFDNALMYRFLWRLRTADIQVPVVAGIMPITNAAQVARCRSLAGCFFPHRFLMLVDRWGDQPAAMEQAGVAYATEQIVDLLANGVTSIHLYTMNKPTVAEAILRNLSELLPPRT